jgi:guanine deaminase
MAETARDTVIRGGRVLDISSGTAPEIDLLIVNGIIADMGSSGLAAPAEALVLEATDRLLIPGLVNAHTHSHGALGRGAVGDRILLEQFLAAAPAINGARTLEEKYLSAKLSAVEMVRRGCTACYDMSVELPAPTAEGLHAVGQAYRDTGMRAVVAPMMADLTVYQAIPGLLDALPAEHRALVADLRAAPGATSLAACQAALRTWPFDRTLVRPGIAPTIPLHCSDEFLVGCHSLAKDFDVPLQTHLGETRTQAVAGRQRYGRSLTAHLSSLGLLDSLFSAAHGIWLDDQDMHLLAEAGVAGVSHNPMSNLRVGSGVAAVRRMISAGLTVGIGTDASNTSDGQNMFEATRLCAYLSRIVDADPNRWLSAEDAFSAATVGSAAILGMGRVGRLAPGWAADIVFLDLAEPHFVPLRHALRQMVFGENGASVRRVMIAGRTIVENGRVLTVDEAALRRQAESAADRLARANEPARELSSLVVGHVGCFCLGVMRHPLDMNRRIDA